MPKENKTVKISVTNVLQSLWKDGFFTVWKKYADISSKLATLGYNFTSAELSKTLGRAIYLTQRGKRGGYEFIQKGPYLP